MISFLTLDLANSPLDVLLVLDRDFVPRARVAEQSQCHGVTDMKTANTNLEIMEVLPFKSWERHRDHWDGA